MRPDEMSIIIIASLLTLSGLASQLISVRQHGAKSPSPIGLRFLIIYSVAAVLYSSYAGLVYSRNEDADSSVIMMASNALFFIMSITIIALVVKTGKIVW